MAEHLSEQGGEAPSDPYSDMPPELRETYSKYQSYISSAELLDAMLRLELEVSPDGRTLEEVMTAAACAEVLFRALDPEDRTALYLYLGSKRRDLQ